MSRILQDSALVSNHFVQSITSDCQGIRVDILETGQAIESLLKDKANEGQYTDDTEPGGHIALAGLQEIREDEEGDISGAQVSMLPARDGYEEHRTNSPDTNNYKFEPRR